MGFTYIAQAKAYSTDVGTTLDCSGALNVAAGDLLVAAVHWDSTASTPSIADTAAGNSMTMQPAIEGSIYVDVAIGYKIAADANSTSTFRFTLSNEADTRGIVVFQFRPDAGETVTKDAGEAGSTADNNTPQTGNISTTGDDEVVVGAIAAYSTTGWSEAEINDEAVDGEGGDDTGNYWMHLGYKVFTEPKSDIHYQAVQSTTRLWAADIIAFKSAAAGGGQSVVPIIFQHYARLRQGN